MCVINVKFFIIIILVLSCMYVVIVFGTTCDDTYVNKCINN